MSVGPGAEAARRRPEVVVFDVNETLSDMAPLARRFAEVGAPASLAELWFTRVLRDGFALTASGDDVGFADVAEGVLRTTLPPGLDRSLDQAVAYVLDGLAGLGVHPDVPDGVRALSAAGFRLATLSNGAVSSGEQLLERAGVREEFELLLSVEDASGWKPARAAYEHGVRSCGVEPGDLLLVAVHPWDVHGAGRAGLRTAWLNRAGAAYPAHFRAPDVVVTDLRELADLIS